MIFLGISQELIFVDKAVSNISLELIFMDPLRELIFTDEFFGHFTGTYFRG